MRIVRALIAAVMLGGVASAAFAPPAADAAPAAIEIGQITFSEGINERGEPVNPQIEFGSDTERVWISFGFRGNAGEKLSFLVRIEGEDAAFGDLDCCTNAEGRFAFPLERQSGNDLPGGAYELFLYSGETQVGQAGFGVRGRGGLDDNDNDDIEYDFGENDND